MDFPLVIIGAGGHGAEVAAYALDLGCQLLGVLDDGKPPGPWHCSHILGGINALPELVRKYGRVGYITALGSNPLRQKIVCQIEELALPSLQAVTLHHTSAWVGVGVEIGEGTLLAPGSLVTTRARIGRHSILNVKASVAHDCLIGDYCNLNPGATLCGGVQLGNGCSIGAAVTVIEKRCIGERSVVGAGAVVIDDIPPDVTVVGIPARIVKRHACE
ncbi:MAG: acetyltransferase [Acidobacteria bacterium]|nr:acetyltransferase [Acidobacteriota bacterium]MBI3425585.1 acetyltransferase [Acidobacteriota bacterium]